MIKIKSEANTLKRKKISIIVKLIHELIFKIARNNIEITFYK